MVQTKTYRTHPVITWVAWISQTVDCCSDLHWQAHWINQLYSLSIVLPEISWDEPANPSHWVSSEPEFAGSNIIICSIALPTDLFHPWRGWLYHGSGWEKHTGLGAGITSLNLAFCGEMRGVWLPDWAFGSGEPWYTCLKRALLRTAKLVFFQS